MMLTGKQKQYLESQAVQLPAYVQIGKEGLTDTVIDSVRDVLLARELVKVKINQIPTKISGTPQGSWRISWTAKSSRS